MQGKQRAMSRWGKWMFGSLMLVSLVFLQLLDMVGNDHWDKRHWIMLGGLAFVFFCWIDLAVPQDD